jgi:hypothetical protein
MYSIEKFRKLVPPLIHVVPPLPTVAKALAAWTTAVFNKDLTLQQVLFEGDALQIVQALKSGGRSWSRLGQLKDTKPALDNKQNLSIDHIKREAKSVTHCLAKQYVSSKFLTKVLALLKKLKN